MIDGTMTKALRHLCYIILFRLRILLLSVVSAIMNDNWVDNFCFLPCFQLEAIMVEMQDTKSGIKGSEQKLNVTTIPHVISGETKIHTKP